MKKTVLILCAFAALVSCKSLKEEWEPVVNCKNPEPYAWIPATVESLKANEGLESFTTIKDLKAMYKTGPIELSGNVWIKGQVISSDKNGNIYNEIYLQDETGGIDLKLGKSSLYNEYNLGQWVFVKCDGLTLGSYKGMPQLGFKADDTSTNEYETSYISLQAIIDTHVFKGEKDQALSPLEVDEAAIKTSLSAGFNGSLWGTYVTVKGLTYDNKIFALFNPNPNMNHKLAENRVFLQSDQGTWGVNTWACTKPTFIAYLESGIWDVAQVGSGSTMFGPITGTPRQYLTDGKTLDSFGADADLTYKEIMIKYASANYISHYFKVGGTNVQVRSSGYAKFADQTLDPKILAGDAVDITGILTIYDGAAQFTLVDDPSTSVVVE